MDSEILEKLNKFRKRGIWTSTITFLVIPILFILLPNDIWREIEPKAITILMIIILTLLWTSVFRALK